MKKLFFWDTYKTFTNKKGNDSIERAMGDSKISVEIPNSNKVVFCFWIYRWIAVISPAGVLPIQSMLS